jgi:DNA-binding IscR family transcriptional regulator
MMDARGLVHRTSPSDFASPSFTCRRRFKHLVNWDNAGSTSGRFGGLCLAVPASSIRIGSVVAALESMGHLVNCNKGPCPLDGACLLKLSLDRAERAFFLELGQYSLADVVHGPTADVFDMLLSA